MFHSPRDVAVAHPKLDTCLRLESGGLKGAPSAEPPFPLRELTFFRSNECVGETLSKAVRSINSARPVECHMVDDFKQQA